MNLLKCILTNNLCYKANRQITPKGIMVHSTGANNPNLKRYVQPLDTDPDAQELLALLGTNPYHNDWNHTDREACVHAFIGKLANGSVATVQTLPWNWRGWHAGVGTTGQSANNTHISFEICEDALTDKSYFEQTKNEAVQLVAMLCKLYNLDPTQDGVIICHQDGYKRGVAENHSDIYNWWPKFNYNMDDFRAEVVNAINEQINSVIYYETRDDVPEYYLPTIDKLIKTGGLKGTGNGVLHLSDDMCRVFTVLDRLGKL